MGVCGIQKIVMFIFIVLLLFLSLEADLLSLVIIQTLTKGENDC